jgi:CDP-4-dehydro-6-deoxyglucose reductase, E1
MQVKLHEPTFGEEEIAAAVEVLRSTNVTSGNKVKEFEKAFSYAHSVMCNSGSSANLLAVAALCNPVMNALHPGDEVIISALSWSTTVWPLVQHGLVPVIVDIDPETLNIDMRQVKQAIGPRTRAIMPVHVYGNPCDLDQLTYLNDRYWIIEDCCEALGATWNDRPVGTFGEIGTFSFYFSHHMTTLEGGMCVSDREEISDLMRILRAHGWTRDLDDDSEYRKQYHDIDPRFLFVNAGYNLRATELQAAIGLVQLNKLNSFIEARRKTAKRLTEIFSHHDIFQTQQELPKGKSSWFGFPVVVKQNPTSPWAGHVREKLEKNGIETRALICGNIARQPAMKLWPHRIWGDLKHADHVMKQGFSIPCHQGMTDESCEHIRETLMSI